MSDERVVIATRQSQLALWQAHFVQDQLRRAHPGLQVDLLGVTTQGDRWLQAPLAQVGGKGLFIKELEQALSEGRADIAVHSVKDVPAELPDGFALPVIGFREDVRDALVCRMAAGLRDLPAGARIGSSSLRRRSQLLLLRADLEIAVLRGNVDTRLKKLSDGEFDAIVLAAAGLRRLGLGEEISEYLGVDDFLPAPGQGALGIECRADDVRTLTLLQSLADDEVHARVSAERAVSAALGADCSAPLAAFAEAGDSGIRLRALLAAPDGSQALRAEATGNDPSALGVAVAESLIGQGAASILGA